MKAIENHMIDENMGFVGIRPGVYSMGASKSEVFSEGTSLTLSSAAAPLTALTLYGKSTQDGTPSPDNPVPIVSAGDSGEIEVSVGGGQLIKPIGNFPISGRGVTLSQNADGSFHLSGTATSDGNLRIVNPDIESYSLDIKEATLSLIAKNGEFDGMLVLSDAEQSWTTLLVVRESNKKTGQVKAGKVGCFVTFTSGKNYDVDLYPMLNIGSTALSFEPYVTPQTLILSTPDGLPGIPVDSGGNYTDESGQQWVCDEVDFDRGMYVQRLNKKILTSALPWKFALTTGNGNNNFQVRLTSEESATDYPSGKPVNSMCNFLKYAGVAWDDDEINLPKIYASSLEITASFPPDSEVNSLQKWNELLDGIGNCYIYYILDIPIETPLSAEQISAYKALHTYSPATTVSNDAEAWMKVGYYSNAALEKMSREALKINGGNLK